MKSLGFPGSFKYGSGILKDFEQITSCYGSKYVFIGGKRSTAAVKDEIISSFKSGNSSYEFIECGKIATLSEIARVEALDAVKNADVVCAIGGGSAMDVARTVGNRLKKALVMIPTTVASDAPCSSVSVFYSEDGKSVTGDQVFHKCPDLVMVDSKVIAEAPTRHIAAGMGDGLATYYEATTNYNNPKRNDITELGMTLGELARDLILTYGQDAYKSVELKAVTPALEKVIEANCFLSGTGGANSGCSAAHGIGDYLTGVQHCHDFMHGERVFVGLMVQLILEDYPKEELIDLMEFGRSVGLPLCLNDLHVENVEETAYEMAKGLQNDHFMVMLNCDYSVDILAGAFILANKIASEIK